MTEQDDTPSGFQRLSDRAEGRADRIAGDLADSKHPGWKIGGWFVAFLAVLVVLHFAFGVINFGAEATHEAKRVLSVKNIREQEEAILHDWQNLLVAAGNACEATEKKSNENSPTFLENPSAAYAATARRARTDYNERQHSLFQARLVGPKGYPKTVPEDTAMDGPKPDWCAISEDLHKTHE